MEIKVYISSPYMDYGYSRHRELKELLLSMVDDRKVTFTVLNLTRSLITVTAFDDLVRDISKIAEADFVIFDGNWKIDKRCLIEDEIVVRYGIPHCEAKSIKTFFRAYIDTAFKLV